MSVDPNWSSGYIDARQDAIRVLATATLVHIKDFSDQEYREVTMNGGPTDSPCLLYTDNREVVLPLPSRSSAFEPGLLFPRFATEASRVLDSLPVTLYPSEAYGQAGTGNSMTTAPQHTPARSQARKSLGYFSESPVVFVDPIDKLTFEQESGQKSKTDFSPSTRHFFRMSASLQDPAGSYVPDYSRKHCVAGWGDVIVHLRGTHMKASTTRVTENTPFKLLPKKNKGKRTVKKSTKSHASGTRPTSDGNAGEGPSGSIVRSQDREF